MNNRFKINWRDSWKQAVFSALLRAVLSDYPRDLAHPNLYDVFGIEEQAVRRAAAGSRLNYVQVPNTP